MSEANADDINNDNVDTEKTKARDTPKHGSHFTQQPHSKYEEEEEESKE